METQERQLMDQAIDEAVAHSRELLAVCPTITNLFTVGGDEEAIKKLQFLITGLGAISQAVQLTHPLIEERSGSINLEELPPVLEPLIHALENRDYPLVGDIVTYEIEPILARWSESLTALTGGGSAHVGPGA